MRLSFSRPRIWLTLNNKEVFGIWNLEIYFRLVGPGLAALLRIRTGYAGEDSTLFAVNDFDFSISQSKIPNSSDVKQISSA